MRKSVERQLFSQTFKYRIGFVNRCIVIIRYCRDERRASAYRNLLFRMMGALVTKNVTNYLNLLNGANVVDIPTRDEVIADCYVMFNRCLEKFVILKGANFYFYFNKSMSRNFYTLYKKSLKDRHGDISEALNSTHPNLRTSSLADDTDIIFTTCGFNELEVRISRSRFSGQRKVEFLANNPDVTPAMYGRALAHIKQLLAGIRKQYKHGEED